MNKIILFPILLWFSFFSCEETDNSPECPDNASCIDPSELSMQYLDSLRTIILNTAMASTCSAQNECLFTGLGSKPCGGPWEYLIYSSTVDTSTLLDLVDKYNAMEKELNISEGKGSDCSIAPAPDSVACGGGGCIAYRNGTEFKEAVCCN